MDSPREQIENLWSKRNDQDDYEEREHIESQMAIILERYAKENYPDVDDEDILITVLKRDFESDLLPAVVANALDVSPMRARRFRYTSDRGVIDTHVGERKSIPPSVRDKIKKRDNDACTACNEPDPDLALHHIIPKSHGGVDHESNMAMLCPMCHEDAHCGDFNSGRLAYDDKEEYWLGFCGKDEIPDGVEV